MIIRQCNPESKKYWSDVVKGFFIIKSEDNETWKHNPSPMDYFKFTHPNQGDGGMTFEYNDEVEP